MLLVMWGGAAKKGTRDEREGRETPRGVVSKRCVEAMCQSAEGGLKVGDGFGMLTAGCVAIVCLLIVPCASCCEP